MVIRILIVFLFIVINSYASNCIKCHTPHYEKVADCQTCHRGISLTSRKDIAHFNLITSEFADFITDENSLGTSRKITEDAGCRRCHLLESSGNSLARNLHSSGEKSTGEYIFKMIKEPNEYMPNFQFDNGTITKIAKLILLDGATREKNRSLSYPVFLDSDVKNVFGEKCGNCHKALLRNTGPAGNGNIGPNLSGIFTAYYKANVLKNDEKFSEDILRKWLKNPRAIFKNTLMPNISLSDKELNDLIQNLK